MIYIDILISLNIIINYFLLILTFKYNLIKPKRKYIFISSLIGGFYSLVTLMPKMNFLIICIFKLIFCFFMVVIAFGRKNLFKNYYTFLIINFIFSGLMVILWMFSYPPGMRIHNGIIYFNISTLTLIISISIAYFLINIFTIVSKKVPIKVENYITDIYIDGKSVTLNGFVDTGNFLCDFFSSSPIIICNYNAIKSILPDELKSMFKNSDINGNVNFAKYNIRITPYKTIDGEKMMLCFKPEKIVLKLDNKKSTITDVYIGINSQSNISNKDYDVILNPLLIKI